VDWVGVVVVEVVGEVSRILLLRDLEVELVEAGAVGEKEECLRQRGIVHLMVPGEVEKEGIEGNFEAEESSKEEEFEVRSNLRYTLSTFQTSSIIAHRDPVIALAFACVFSDIFLRLLVVLSNASSGSCLGP